MITPSSDELTRRVRRYWVEDGLAEMVIGIGFLLLVLLTLVDLRWDLEIWPVVRAGYIVLFVVGTRWVVQRLKWRITYPRTGYLTYPRTPVTARVMRIALGSTIGAAAIFVGAVLLSHDQARAYLVTLTLILALPYLFMARSQDWARGVVYAALVLLGGALAVALLPLAAWREMVLQGGLHFAVLGLAQLIGGGLALRRYLRHHPQPLEGDL